MVLCGSYVIVQSPSVGRPSGNDVCPYRRDQSTSRAERRRVRGHLQSPTDSCLPPTLSVVTAQSCRRRQRHCSGGGRSWVSGQQACWSATTVVTDQRVAKQRSDRYVAGDVSLMYAGRHRRLAVFTLWRLKDRALLKLENGRGSSHRQAPPRDYPQSMLPVMGNTCHGLAA